jgi:hypothetical protein
MNERRGRTMPATITTEVYTLTELVERGDDRAVDRALSWMLEAWDDVAVERATEAIDMVLDDLCGTTGRERGMRQGPITWSSWDRYGAYVWLAYNFGPDDLSLDFPEDHPLHGLGALPEGVMRVSRGKYEASITMDYDDEGFHAEVTPSAESAVEEWLRDLAGRLTQVMVGEYDYCTSRGYLLECAEANGYTFTVDGKRFG